MVGETSATLSGPDCVTYSIFKLFRFAQIAWASPTYDYKTASCNRIVPERLEPAPVKQLSCMRLPILKTKESEGFFFEMYFGDPSCPKQKASV